VRLHLQNSAVRIEDILGDVALLLHLVECASCRRMMERLNRGRELFLNLYRQRN
jgi:hypothetical protein